MNEHKRKRVDLKLIPTKLPSGAKKECIVIVDDVPVDVSSLKIITPNMAIELGYSPPEKKMPLFLERKVELWPFFILG